MEQLKRGSNGIKKDSSLYRLDPVLDGELLRVGGRLRKASMPIEFKHPIILSKNHHISQLLLRNIHEQLGHSGRNHVIQVKTNLLDYKCQCCCKKGYFQMCCM